MVIHVPCHKYHQKLLEQVDTRPGPSHFGGAVQEAEAAQAERGKAQYRLSVRESSALFRLRIIGCEDCGGKQCGIVEHFEDRSMRWEDGQLENQVTLDALRQAWQDGAEVNETKKQFSFTGRAPNVSGRCK